MTRNLFDVAGWSGLHEIERLLKKGVSVDQRFHSGMTPLMNAAHAGHFAAVELLLARGASINAASNHGVTALGAAARACRNDMVDTLINHGADLEHANESGETPLLIAATYGLASTVRLLLARGANPRATTHRGWSAVMCAAYNRQQFYFPHDAMRALIEAGVDANHRGADGKTAYSIAIELADDRKVQVLAAHGALR